METFLHSLLGMSEITQPPFRPVARYHPDMDILIYVREDCSYRADRVDAFLTVLYDPYADELVGLKLKGFKFLFKQLQSIINLPDDAWMPLVKALELALVGGVAQNIMNEVEAQRIRLKYDQARTFARDVNIPPDEWARAA